MIVKALRRSFKDMFIDVHIMAEPAEAFIDMFIDTRPDALTVQAESTRHIHRALQIIRGAGVRPGVSLNPGTSLSVIEPILHMIDLVLVMTVNPGFGGQSFLPEVLPKISGLVQLRAARKLDFLIEADGGVNQETAGRLASSGCDVLVAGSSVFDREDPAEAVRIIRGSADKNGECKRCNGKWLEGKTDPLN
jgi:ribulose-phosphate 3-epimerase